MLLTATKGVPNVKRRSRLRFPQKAAAVLSAAGVLVITAACDEKLPSGPTVPLNAEFTLAVGQITTVNQAAINIRFVAVVEDSRCPADAICVRAGDAIVRLDVTPAFAGNTVYDLHTENPKMSTATHGDVTIALLQVAPYPLSASRPIPQNEYRATLRVTR